MKILHYINTLDRSFGGTTTYMQMLALSLRSKAELVFVADASPNPVEISGAKVIFMQSKWYSRSRYKKEWTAILDADDLASAMRVGSVVGRGEGLQMCAHRSWNVRALDCKP